MPLSSINSATPASPVPLDTFATRPLPPETAKIAEAARQFEAVLLRQILASARRTVITSELNSSSPGSDVYEDMINDLLATTISRTGAFGLASALQAQWQASSPATPNAQSPPDGTPTNPAAAPPLPRR